MSWSANSVRQNWKSTTTLCLLKAKLRPKSGPLLTNQPFTTLCVAQKVFEWCEFVEVEVLVGANYRKTITAHLEKLYDDNAAELRNCFECLKCVPACLVLRWHLHVIIWVSVVIMSEIRVSLLLVSRGVWIWIIKFMEEFAGKVE